MFFPHQSTQVGTRLHGKRLVLFWIGWVFLVVYTLAAFSQTMRHEMNLNQLREDLLAVVQKTMQPSHVSLWLRNPGASKGSNTRQLPGIDEE